MTAIVVARAEAATHEGAGVLTQPGGLPARAAGLGVGVGVAGEDLGAEEVLEEVQRAAGRRVVGVGHPAGAVGAWLHPVLAENARSDAPQERRLLGALDRPDHGI